MNLNDLSSFSKGVHRSLNFFYCLTEFLTIFASQNIGEVELDVEAISAYVCSDKFQIGNVIVDEIKTRDDIFRYFENLVLEGMPVWDFFKISEWTRIMVEDMFEKENKKHLDELHKTYKCCTCSFLIERNTNIGKLYKCKRPSIIKEIRFNRNPFKFKKRCKYYEKQI